MCTLQFGGGKTYSGVAKTKAMVRKAAVSQRGVSVTRMRVRRAILGTCGSGRLVERAAPRVQQVNG